MKLAVGGIYTSQSQCFAREILAIEGQEVTYRDFTIHNGKPLSVRRRCMAGTFRNWAFRHCTEDETAGLQREPISPQAHLQAILMETVFDAVSLYQKQMRSLTA